MAAESLPQPFIMTFAGLFGAILGSFLNVVIHRLPRKQEIVVTPSACPRCGARIQPWDNIPIVSWLVLGGRCRSCKAPISPRYPLVEAVASILTILNVWYFGLSITAVAYLIFCLALLAITL